MPLPEFQVSQSPQDDNSATEQQQQNATAFSDPIVAPPISLENPVESLDAQFDGREPITSAELPDRICTQCLEDNLIKAGVIETFVRCQKCSEEFCIHGVSKLDPQYCIHCCNDFKIVDVIETEQRPIYNKDGGLIAVRQFKVRHITLSGLHWLFFNRAITNLSDLELEHAIEYHMSIYHGMIYERETRRVQKSHRNKGKVAGNENTNLTQNPFELTQDGVRFVTTTGNPNTKNNKKVRTRTVKVSQSSTGVVGKGKAAPSPEQLQALIQTLMQAGFTEAQILSMGKK
jgi:hypothetical protein